MRNSAQQVSNTKNDKKETYQFATKAEPKTKTS